MRLKITMGFAALALGTALASVPAFALPAQPQTSFHYASGKAANDGGYTGSPSTPSSRSGSAAAAGPIHLRAGRLPPGHDPRRPGTLEREHGPGSPRAPGPRRRQDDQAEREEGQAPPGSRPSL